jgi:hypothetical protein
VRRLLDRLQHIAGLGDMREIELGLDLFDAPPDGTCLLARRRFPVRGKVLPHFLRFIPFN